MSNEILKAIMLGVVLLLFLWSSASDTDLGKEEPEDIEGHIAGINESETPDQVIINYGKGGKYNELVSDAFVNKMVEFHHDAPVETLS